MSLTIPTIKLNIATIDIEPREIIELTLHLGCTSEVSSFEAVIDNGNPDLNAGDYYISGAKEFSNGQAVLVYLKRGSITGSTKRLFTGKVETISIIDEAEDFNYRNVVIIGGRCKGAQLFDRKFDGNLNDAVGVLYKNYLRTSGDASSLIAYLIDNYTSLTHSRVNSAIASQAASAQKVINVADGTKFVAGDLVKIRDGATWEYNKVASVNVNAVTMTSNLINTYENTGYVDLDLIKVSNTSFTQMIFDHETVYDLVKYIADVTSSVGGVIGFDLRIEYDGNFAFLPRGTNTEPYSPLTGECQLERYDRSIAQVKNKIWVYGKADKPFPLEVDSQNYSDTWTEDMEGNTSSALTANAASGQTEISVTNGALFAVGDWVWPIDSAVMGEPLQIASKESAEGINTDLVVDGWVFVDNDWQHVNDEPWLHNDDEDDRILSDAVSFPTDEYYSFSNLNAKYTRVVCSSIYVTLKGELYDGVGGHADWIEVTAYLWDGSQWVDAGWVHFTDTSWQTLNCDIDVFNELGTLDQIYNARLKLLVTGISNGAANKGGVTITQAKLHIEAVGYFAVAGNVLHMTTNLTKSYATANSAILFRLETTEEAGWGFIPESHTDLLTLTLDHGMAHTTGGSSIGVVTNYNLTSFHILLFNRVGIDFSEYQNLNLDTYFNIDEPTEMVVTLWSGSCDSDEWSQLEGQKVGSVAAWGRWKGDVSPTDENWQTGAGFVWTDIKIIDLELVFAAANDRSFWLDRFYVGGKRWGGGSDDAAVDGFAEDVLVSQAAYGIKEYVVTNDMLLSDKECEAKAQSLLAFYKDERRTIELSTETLDWGDYAFTPGNLIAIAFGKLGADDSFRTDAIDISVSGKENRTFITFTIDQTPPRIADYLYRLSKKIRELEKNYSGIR